MNWTALLLASPSICLRKMVLEQLLGLSKTDPEMIEIEHLAHRDPFVVDLLSRQNPDGSWSDGHSVDRSLRTIHTTAFALKRLSYLGLDRTHPQVERAATYLLSLQQPDGSWPLLFNGPDETEQDLDDGYSMIPLQTAIPLLGLISCGYPGHDQVERGCHWLLEQRLDDGSWPTGIAAGNYGRVAGYRKIAHSRWGCRSNTTAALICLAYHPKWARSEETQRALDLLLGRETRETETLGFELARILGYHKISGFLTLFARFDLALVLDLCWRIGADHNDPRIADLITFINNQRNSFGLWEYKGVPIMTSFLTFDLLRSLSHLNAHSDWTSFEPRTPFQSYPKKTRRF
ncbi:hypothetical protein JXQ70_03005 [bacterium]|nr:hypothetical protein [bacterium]